MKYRILYRKRPRNSAEDSVEMEKMNEVIEADNDVDAIRAYRSFKESTEKGNATSRFIYLVYGMVKIVQEEKTEQIV